MVFRITIIYDIVGKWKETVGRDFESESVRFIGGRRRVEHSGRQILARQPRSIAARGVFPTGPC